MKRIDKPTLGKPKRLVQHPDQLTRPSVYKINPDRSKYNPYKRRLRRYGEKEYLIIEGDLYIEDREIFLCIMELARPHRHKKFPFHVKELLRIKGVQNINNPVSQRRMISGVRRLLNSTIRFFHRGIPEPWGKISFCDGKVFDDGNGWLSIGQFLDDIKKYELGDNYVDLDFYLSIQSKIAQALFVYLGTQQDFYNGRGYKIGVEKLCSYLYYLIGDKEWWEVRKNLTGAIDELKEKKYLAGKTWLNKDRLKGGIVYFYAGKKGLRKPKELTPFKNKPGDAYAEILNVINDNFKEGKQQINWTKNNIRKLRSNLHAMEQHPKTDVEDMTGWVDRYCSWLKKNSAVHFIHPVLFDPEREFYQQWLKGNSPTSKKDPTSNLYIEPGKQFSF